MLVECPIRLRKDVEVHQMAAPGNRMSRRGLKALQGSAPQRLKKQKVRQVVPKCMVLLLSMDPRAASTRLYQSLTEGRVFRITSIALDPDIHMPQKLIVNDFCWRSPRHGAHSLVSMVPIMCTPHLEAPPVEGGLFVGMVHDWLSLSV